MKKFQNIESYIEISYIEITTTKCPVPTVPRALAEERTPVVTIEKGMKHRAWPNVYNAFVSLEIQQNRLIFGTIDQKDMFLLFIKKSAYK